jgi:ribulose-phosphate 3-epimerase
MPKPASDWIARLPRDRLIAEYSMWSADLVRLADDLARIAPHADILHVDVADGHFAPALLFFPDLVARMRDITAIPIHVHLMVADTVLLAQIDQFADAGADLISLHAENAVVAAAALDLLAQRGVAAGMVLRVETPVVQAARWLPRLHMLTLLGTAIGVKGQGLDPKATARLQEAAGLIAAT